MRESTEERTREVPVGPAFVPGDIVGIEMGSVRHRADLREVLAVFCGDVGGDDGRPPHEITLRGRPEVASSRRHSSGGGRVTLSAVVPADVAPGEYRCRRLEAETHEGRRVPFEPVTESAWRSWRFRVR